MKKVWENAEIKTLDVQETAQFYTEKWETDFTIRGEGGNITGYIVGAKTGSGPSHEIVNHEGLK